MFSGQIELLVYECGIIMRLPFGGVFFYFLFSHLYM